MRATTIKSTLTAAGNSEVLKADQCFSVSLMAVGEGTLAGSIKLQFSNDPVDAEAPTNWVDIPTATVALTAAAKVGIAKIDVCYNWVRANFSSPTGTGSVTLLLKSNGY